MEMTHLPPTFVPYLNALSLNSGDPTAEREGFLSALDDLAGWLQWESGYTLDDEESGHFENLQILHQGLMTTLEVDDRQKQLDELVPPLYQTVALMDKINARRERPHYSAQPAVNDFLMCGAAYLQKRATAEAVEARLGRLEDYVKVLRHAYKGAQVRFLPEVSQALDTGFEHLKNGMKQAADTLDAGGDPFQDSLATIKEGAEVMQNLIDWQREDERRLAERNRRFAIPLVGPFLQSTLDMGRGMPRAQWRRGVKHMLETVIPSLEDYWARGQLKVLIRPDARAELLQNIEEGIEELKACIEALADDEVPAEEAVENCESALQILSDAFEAAQEASLSFAHLRGTMAGAYIDAILGAVNNTVPILAFSELFHESNPPDDWNPVVAEMLEFGRDGNTDHLFKAGFLLVSKYPPPPDAESHPQNWPCPFCGHINPVGQQKCAGCHSAPKVDDEEREWAG